MSINQNRKQIGIITGASSGIGAAIAEHLAAQDIIVIATYNQNLKGATELLTRIESKGGRALIRKLDVTSESSVQRLSEEIDSTYGVLDFLINNAGSDKALAIEDCSYDVWTEITRVKIDGNFLCTKYFLSLLKRSDNPNLIVISSSLGLKPDPQDPAYSIGAVAATTFGKIMAISLAPYGIRSNVIIPGSIPTNLEYWQINGTPALWGRIREQNPRRRLCKMSDITSVVDFVLGKEASFINGNVFYVTGGAHLIYS
jgi:NAD(P)-dependent dehydrogenase (short-subunit alcohol dehydrogenase family)